MPEDSVPRAFYFAAEVLELPYMGFEGFFIFNGAQSETAAAFYFKMSVEMLDAADDTLTFPHAWTCPQSYGVALFAAAQAGVGLMSVAPGSAPVDESFELPGDISPVGRRNADNNICPFKLVHDKVNIVMLNTFCSSMAAPTALTKAEIIVVDTDRLHSEALGQLLRNYVNYLRSSTVSYGTAINDKCIHFKTSDINNKPDYTIFRSLCQALNKRVSAKVV